MLGVYPEEALFMLYQWLLSIQGSSEIAFEGQHVADFAFV